MRELKHKLRPENAYFKAKEFEFVLSAPKEELHQFLIGLYGDHLLPATMYEIKKALRGPETIRGYAHDGRPNQNSAPEYAVPTSRSHCTRGTIHTYNYIVYDILHDIFYYFVSYMHSQYTVQYRVRYFLYSA